MSLSNNMFNKSVKKEDIFMDMQTRAMVNFLIGMARAMKISPEVLGKESLDTISNNQYIKQMSDGVFKVNTTVTKNGFYYKK